MLSFLWEFCPLYPQGMKTRNKHVQRKNLVQDGWLLVRLSLELMGLQQKGEDTDSSLACSSETRSCRKQELSSGFPEASHPVWPSTLQEALQGTAAHFP